MSNNISICKEQIAYPLFPVESGDQFRFGFTQISKNVRTWISRSRQRQHLADLDNHLLEDIGLTRKQAEVEAAKPFWVK